MLIRDADRATLWSAQHDAGPFGEILKGGEEAFFRVKFDFFLFDGALWCQRVS